MLFRFHRIFPIFVLLTIIFLSCIGCQPKEEPKPNVPAEKSGSSEDHVTKNENPKTATAKINVPEPNAETNEVLSPPLEHVPGSTPQMILDAMVRAYQKTNTYSDHGKVEIVLETPKGEKKSATFPCVFAYKKPNCVRMEVSDGNLVCDGSNIFGAVLFPEFYDKVLDRKAPAAMDIESLYPDYILMQAMDMQIPPNILLLPPQIVLLFAKNPLQTLAPSGAELTLLQPKYLNGLPCDRVAVSDSRGQRVFWVRRDTNALLRMELPTELITSPEGKITSFCLDFSDAELGAEINAEAFAMETPVDAVHVSELVPRELMALGNVPKNNIVHDELGREVKLGLGEGKITLCMLFSVDPEAATDCQTGMQTLKQLQETFKENNKVAFYPISLDNSNDALPMIRESLKKWNVSLPFYQIAHQETAQELNLDAVPLFLIFGADGRLQVYLRGVVGPEILKDATDQLLAGNDIFQRWKDENKQIQETFEKMLADYIQSDIFFAGEPKVEISQASKPKNFKLTRLWEKELANACNPIVVNRPEHEDLLVVPNHLQFLSVMTKTGDIVPSAENQEKIKPDGMTENEPLHYVRETINANGERFLAAFACNGPGVHFLDYQLKSTGSWPQNTQNSQPMIGDVQLAALSESAAPDTFISFLANGSGKDALLRLDSEKNTLWNNDTFFFPDQLAIVYKNNSPGIWTIHRDEDPYRFVELDLSGKELRKWVPSENAILWKFIASDLEGDGNSEICTVMIENNGYVLCGIGPDGTVTWKYPFPSGNHKAFQFEFLKSGNVLGDATKEWILVSADSTIHLLNNQGKLLDSFAFGQPMTGIAVAHWDGHAVLIITTTNNTISAWQVE